MDLISKLVVGIFVFVMGGFVLTEGILLILNDKYVALMTRFSVFVARVFQGDEASSKIMMKRNSSSFRHLDGITFLISGTFFMTLSLMMIIRTIAK